MSYSGPPYWPPEYDEDYWCPGQDLDMDMESCDDCPLYADCTADFKQDLTKQDPGILAPNEFPEG